MEHLRKYTLHYSISFSPSDLFVCGLLFCDNLVQDNPQEQHLTFCLTTMPPCKLNIKFHNFRVCAPCVPVRIAIFSWKIASICKIVSIFLSQLTLLDFVYHILWLHVFQHLCIFVCSPILQMPHKILSIYVPTVHINPHQMNHIVIPPFWFYCQSPSSHVSFFLIHALMETVSLCILHLYPHSESSHNPGISVRHIFGC